MMFLSPLEGEQKAWIRECRLKRMLTLWIGMYGTIVAIMLLTSGNGVTKCL